MRDSRQFFMSLLTAVDNRDGDRESRREFPRLTSFVPEGLTFECHNFRESRLTFEGVARLS